MTKIINTTVIKNLNPCDDRFDNWIKYYNDFEGNLNDFMALDKITFSDKIWVGVRVLNRNQQIEFACQCAELVLPIYEEYNSDSSVLKTAINAARTAKASFAAAFAAEAAAKDAAKAAAKAYAAAKAAYFAADAAAFAAAYAAKVAYAAKAANASYAAAKAAARADPKMETTILNIFRVLMPNS